jgi:hypothetical protein
MKQNFNPTTKVSGVWEQQTFKVHKPSQLIGMAGFEDSARLVQQSTDRDDLKQGLPNKFHRFEVEKRYTWTRSWI